DPVDLVPGVLPELGRVHPALAVPVEALRVAVPVRPDERVERVARRGLAVGRHPQDLAAEAGQVLRTGGLRAVAGRRVQEAVGAEREPAAVVDARLWNGRA